MVEVRNLSKRFQRANGTTVNAVDDTSFTVGVGEIVVLLGPSGCGKTTLLRCLAGLESADEGEIEIGGKLVYSSAKRVNVAPQHRPASMVFQSYALWPHMTAFKNVAYPLSSQKAKLTRAAIAEKVNSVLRMVGIGDLGDQYPHQLSGGQQQRVALARALVGGENLILFDEPLSNVDAQVREQLRVEMLEMQHQIGFAAVYVTHDQAEAMLIADQIAVVDAGRIQQLGTPREVYGHPRSRFVANFVGTSNEVVGKVVSAQREFAVISTKLGTVTASMSASEFAAGDNVVGIWRPEASEISQLAPDGENVWPVTVATSLYTGTYVENILRSDEGPLRQRSTDQGLREVGERLALHVDKRSIRLFAA